MTRNREYLKKVYTFAFPSANPYHEEFEVCWEFLYVIC